MRAVGQGRPPTLREVSPNTAAASPIAWMDGRVLPAADATVPLTDDGFLRGDAVFETILVRGGRTHALKEHLARMRASAKTVGIALPVLKQVVTDLLVAWGERDGAIKLIVTRSRTVRGLAFRPTWPESISLAPVEVPWASALSGVKTISYAVNQHATRLAREAHADDAIVVSGGVVHELPTAAIAWVSGGQVHSPDPGVVPILDSVTRRQLGLVVPVKLGRYTLDDLLAADEAFVLSATRPVLPVHAIGDRELDTPGTRTAELRQALSDHIDATLDGLP